MTKSYASITDVKETKRISIYNEYSEALRLTVIHFNKVGHFWTW